jgi:hypothetical protein
MRFIAPIAFLTAGLNARQPHDQATRLLEQAARIRAEAIKINRVKEQAAETVRLQRAKMANLRAAEMDRRRNAEGTRLRLAEVASLRSKANEAAKIQEKANELMIEATLEARLARLQGRPEAAAQAEEKFRRREEMMLQAAGMRADYLAKAGQLRA